MLRFVSLLLLAVFAAVPVYAGSLTDALQAVRAVPFEAAPEIVLQVHAVLDTAIVDARVADAANASVRLPMYKQVRNMTQLTTGLDILLLEVPDRAQRTALAEKVDELKSAINTWLALHHPINDSTAPVALAPH